MAITGHMVVIWLKHLSSGSLWLTVVPEHHLGLGRNGTHLKNVVVSGTVVWSVSER